MGSGPAAHVVSVAACRQFVALTTDFIERGEAFVVNQPSTLSAEQGD